MSISVETTVAPEYWAPYLVNGDASGYMADEIEEMNAWIAKLAPWRVVGVGDESPYVGRYAGLDMVMCEYVLHCEEGALLDLMT